MKKIFLFLGALIVLSSPVSALTAYATSVSCVGDAISNCENSGDGDFDTYTQLGYGAVGGYHIHNFALQEGNITDLNISFDNDCSDDGWQFNLFCQLNDGSWNFVSYVNRAHYRATDTISIPLECILSNNLLSIKFSDEGYNQNYVLLWEVWVDYEYSIERADFDGDGIPDDEDNCPTVYNPNQEDSDEDRMGDACDKCPNDPSNDIDNDSVCGDTDNCPNEYNPTQVDLDKDGIGFACDANVDIYSKSEIDNKINPLISQIASLQEILKAIQATLNGFIDKIMTYLKYLPKGTRQNMLCGYMKENKLKSYKDLGLECRITRGKCYCN